MEFKNKFTLDGMLRPRADVTPEKVAKVAKMVEAAKGGSWLAEAQLKESMMSGVLANSVAHFMNVITIPQLPDDKDRPVAKLATFRTVSDFRPVVLYGLYGKLEGAGIDADGSLAPVPQGQPYPEVTIKGKESAYAKLGKNGARINWDFEDFINDTVGVLDSIPALMRQAALDTEWNEVGEAIATGGVAMAGATLPDGTVVPPNAPVSANAIIAAIQESALRKVNGSKIGTLGGYNVVVPVGSKPGVEFSIRQALGIMSILPPLSTGGAVTIGPDNSILNTVEVIEHDKMTGTNWALVPKPGAYKGRPLLDVLRLRGYEQPQLRVKSDGGDGFSFDADTASMRIRLVTGAARWENQPIVKSNGTGL